MAREIEEIDEDLLVEQDHLEQLGEVLAHKRALAEKLATELAEIESFAKKRRDSIASLKEEKLFAIRVATIGDKIAEAVALLPYPGGEVFLKKLEIFCEQAPMLVEKINAAQAGAVAVAVAPAPTQPATPPAPAPPPSQAEVPTVVTIPAQEVVKNEAEPEEATPPPAEPPHEYGPETLNEAEAPATTTAEAPPPANDNLAKIPFAQALAVHRRKLAGGAA